MEEVTKLNQGNQLEIADKSFGLPIREFEFTVPADYNHNEQIDNFAERIKDQKITHDYDYNLTSKNFIKATNKLQPGKTYKVDIIPVLKKETSENCETFLSKRKYLLVGGQGLTLVYDLAKEQFPKSKLVVSFDTKLSLYQDPNGRYMLPRILAQSDGSFFFILGDYARGCESYHCLLCVSEKEL